MVLALTHGSRRGLSSFARFRGLLTLALIAALASVPCATAQLAEGFNLAKSPSVSAAPVAALAVSPGKRGKVELDFRVSPGFHINSNRPNSDLLLPTTLRLSPPTDVMVSKFSYPPGTDLSLAFMPGEKVNVYTGDFAVTALVSTAQSISLGIYRVHGALKYQACDNRQCYPPKEVPVEFDVKVQKPKSTNGRHNPGQSPHIHQ